MYHFKIRDNEYFNEQDHFIAHNNLGRIFITKLEFSKGYYWTEESMQYKANTVPLMNANDIIGSRVLKDGAEGRIVKFLAPDDVGVIWDQGQKHLNYFWNNIKTLQWQ